MPDETSSPVADDIIEVDLRNPIVAAVWAWIWPGAGHIYQRRYAKGVLFMVCIMSTWIFGLSLADGHVVYASWTTNDHRWHYFCQLGVGAPALPALIQSRRVRDGREPLMDGFMAPPRNVLSDSASASALQHDELAQSILITHVKGLVTRVQDQVKRQLAVLDRKEIATQSIKSRGAIVVTKNLAESMRIADEYAPEHLLLAVEDPETTSKSVQNAGAIFLGHYTPVAVGDYIAGPNHVIPTGGTARFFSPLSVDDFLKRTSFMKFEPPKLRELGADIVRLANVEGLSGHGASVELRLQKIRRARREREAAREAEL